MENFIAESRRIVTRTRGRSHGPVTRVVSPSDLGERIKPFVFLDDFEPQAAADLRFGIHPHSGIATITVLLQGDLNYEDTTGKSGVLPAGGVEWMRAAGGVWHDSSPVPGGSGVRGLQLWIALPAAEENGPAESQYVDPQSVPQDGPVRVILGSYGKARSPVRAPAGINYLDVRLQGGERWEYQPPPGHGVAWLYSYQGALRAAGEVVASKELVVFEEGASALRFEAKGDTAFVLGTAVKHPHDLVLGYYSVHTSAQALEAGEASIAQIGKRLKAEGRL